MDWVGLLVSNMANGLHVAHASVSPRHISVRALRTGGTVGATMPYRAVWCLLMHCVQHECAFCLTRLDCRQLALPTTGVNLIAHTHSLNHERSGGCHYPQDKCTQGEQYGNAR